MSTLSGDGHHQEIIIVRHGGGDHDDAHHGGVWKIAFADFMTAMMCFFLVMWLINASNEQTKSAVASYFNPVKLIDRNSSRRGLEDIGDGPSAIEAGGREAKDSPPTEGTAGKEDSGPAENKDASDAGVSHAQADQQLFADPYAVLAEIAANTDRRQNISSKGEGGVQTSGPATGADGGKSYRDPFAPDFWSQQVAADGESDKKLEVDTRESKASSAPPAPAEPAPTKDSRTSETDIKTAKKIEQELVEALGKEMLADGVSVTATPQGISISLTEELDFGMFEIGSAVPRPELVRAMDKIGRVLAAQKGSIVVKGHTDARPFSNGAYDNWRLSTARAQTAYYMLARSGLDEKRMVEVAGFADRKLKNSSDPFAAENRRIEILLETGHE
ncbi:MAG: OmpA family protein [Rhizobiaceae bacterium]|nr:OmpA family protein [Rhizobiaceae bacterium]